MTVSHGTRTSSSASSPGIGFGRVHNPVLWHNRTWHWSTNRTREYDPDLDGTTVAPDVVDEDAPPLVEPYDYHFPGGRYRTAGGQTVHHQFRVLLVLVFFLLFNFRSTPNSRIRMFMTSDESLSLFLLSFSLSRGKQSSRPVTRKAVIRRPETCLSVVSIS